MRREIIGTQREATMNARATILVVDDEPGIRFFLEEMLANDGHQVVAVDNGKRALEHIAAEEFDLALVDLRLKDVGGLEVLSTLRQGSPDTVVIVLTGHASLDSAVEALRQGAHDYLFKPCKTVDLRESIRRGLLKRQQKVRQRALMQQLEQQLSNLQDLRTAIAEAPVAPSSPTSTRYSQHQWMTIHPLENRRAFSNEVG
jgi:DNA-binding NtrC family response regulator